MKRYIRVQASSKDDIYQKAKEQRNLNEIYTGLNNLIDAMNQISAEKFDELGLKSFYRDALDLNQKIYKYYKP